MGAIYEKVPFVAITTDASVTLARLSRRRIDLHLGGGDCKLSGS
jgi:hypothetical protein